MDFAFYDHTSPRRGIAHRGLVPLQRAVRRVLRPMFHRLRDLLQYQHDRQQEQAAHVAALASRIAVLESTAAKPDPNQAQAYRALAMDHLAVTRRLTQLEDMLLELTAARQGESNPTLRIGDATAGTARKAA